MLRPAIRLIRVLTLVGAVGLSVLPAVAESAKRQNIIFILADDLGYGDLGCYGQKLIQTPNLDRLAASGVRFRQAYAGSTVCAPSRCALMTGMHTGHARIRGNKDVPLLPEDVTVAEVLKSAGYATALVGKWGLGDPGSTGVPTRQGFDFFYGYMNQKHAHDYYTETLYRNETAETLAGNRDGRRDEYTHDLFTKEALGWLRGRAAEPEKPFFLYLAYTIPHANNERGPLGMEVPSDAPYSDRDWPQPEKNFAAMITRMDADVGRVLALLDELKLRENTIVFFTSDNGPHKEGGHKPDFFDSNGPLQGIKRSLHDGGIRVPMIVSAPGRIPAGATNDAVWAFWDFLPTAAEIAGATAPEGIDGVSVWPILKGEPPPADLVAELNDRPLYWEFHEGGFRQAIRKGPWKALRDGPGAPVRLCDLRTDPGEARDVAGENANLIQRLETIFTDARMDSPDWPVMILSE